MKKNNILIAVVAAVLLFIVFKIQRSKASEDGQLSDPIQKGTIIESVYGIGTVMANRSFEFKAGVINTLHTVFVKEGDFVKQSSPLIELDGGVVIKAPFDGTITALPFKVGETIFAQSFILDLVDLQDRYLVVSLEQRGALRVRRGQVAKLSFDGLREESFEGVVDSVYSNENNFLVRIDISKLPPQVLPDMTADVAIGIQERKDVLLVPVAAIEEGKVYVQRGAGKELVSIKTGIIDGAMAEVISGDLKPGDRLVIRKKVKK
ncbi:MAG: hypothetical protein A2Z88_09115 [Omnitrophica WOR_2 bacterium GWA2_47_8]|nr:MAG: hypothetical protein A2Z88_09115 [Omnitrophica WOR_2 bacterium GWA2_47_8]